MRQVTAALDITVPPTSLMVSPACALVLMVQNKFAAPRERTLMKQEGGLRQTAVNVFLGITVQLDLRHPQFVQQVTTVHLGLVTLCHVLLGHSITTVEHIIWKTVQLVRQDGK